MERVILKRGRGSMELIKSDDLIAIRPSPQTGVEEVLTNATARTSNVGTNLDEFQIVKVNSGNKQQMEQTLDSLRRHHLVDAGSHVYHARNSTAPIVPTGKITLRFTPSSTEAERQQVLTDHHLELVDASIDETEAGTKIDTYTVRTTPASPNPLKIAEQLQQLPSIVALVEPDLATPGALMAFQLPLDTFLKDQWHLENSGIQFGTSLGLKKGADARVIAAWKRLQLLGSTSCIVAVIDDGFDLTHPDLSGHSKVVAPWDFSTNSNNPAPKNFNPDPRRGDYHGTACAGVAIGNANGAGITGAAPDCRFMPVRWTGTISDETIKKQFAYVAAHGAWVVSCSWGAAGSYYEPSSVMNEAIAKCARKGRNGLGCVILFAAGNDDHNINDPAGGTLDGFAVHPDVIAVAACNSLDQKSNYSNFGREISVCAPSNGAGGRGILTCDVRGTFRFNNGNYESGYEAGDYTRTFGGTSSATPLVAGICALILSANPALTAKQVKEILQSTARKIGPAESYVNGHSIYFGYGCVEAEAAVKKALASRAPQPNGNGFASNGDGLNFNLYTSTFWGISRHELIAGVAADLLTPRAKEEIRKLLQPIGQTLREIAGWADQIKGKNAEPGQDDDTFDFLKKYPNDASKKWHYVNLPLGFETYTDAEHAGFTRPDDVVKIIGQCVLVLQGRLDFISKLNALRWLVHLVGDVHQPIHVGCGFIDQTGPTLVTDPKIIMAKGLPDDRGGNRLVLPGSTNLHSYWDSHLPTHPSSNGHSELSVAETTSAPAADGIHKARLVNTLWGMVKRAAVAGVGSEGVVSFANAGPPEDWAISWANHSLAEARKAYAPLKIKRELADGRYELDWPGKAVYDTQCQPIVAKQLAAAAKNLAALLNAIPCTMTAKKWTRRSTTS